MSGRATARLLFATAFLRAAAVSAGAVLLALHLAAAGLSAAELGQVVAAGLWGAAAAALLVTWRGDRGEGRTTLVVVALLSAAGLASMAWLSDPAWLALAAFAGMVNGMGRDRGAALILEQAILPSTTDDRGRTRAFGLYNVAQDAGSALGALGAGLAPRLGEPHTGSAGLPLAAALLLVSALVYLWLPRVQAASSQRARIAPETRRRLTRLSALFTLDSLGGGFLTTTLLSYFFFQRFDASPAAIGLLFAGARVANALSHLAAAALARRIGLVNTMVFTHIPSSLLLVTVAFAPSFPVAAALFLLREGLVEMDVPTRQSYVMALVAPEERAFASGVTHVVRMAAWAVAPAFAGLAMQDLSLVVPLVVGATLKIAYDVLLWRSFRHLRPPEEILTLPSS